MHRVSASIIALACPSPQLHTFGTMILPTNFPLSVSNSCPSLYCPIDFSLPSLLMWLILASGTGSKLSHLSGIPPPIPGVFLTIMDLDCEARPSIRAQPQQICSDWSMNRRTTFCAFDLKASFSFIRLLRLVDHCLDILALPNSLLSLT